MPVYAVAFGFFVFASAGLPGLSGFVGEFLVARRGVQSTARAVAAVATFCMILAAGYLLWMFQRMFFGELSEFLKGLGHHLTDMTADRGPDARAAGGAVVVFGLFPGLILDLVAGSVTNVLARRRLASRPIDVAPEIGAIALIAVPILT